jgi:hypothetical protein
LNASPMTGMTGKGEEGAVSAVEAEVMADERQNIGISYAGFCLTSLPHKRLPDDQAWQKHGYRVTLLVEPGRLKRSPDRRPGLSCSEREVTPLRRLAECDGVAGKIEQKNDAIAAGRLPGSLELPLAPQRLLESGADVARSGEATRLEDRLLKRRRRIFRSSGGRP